MPYYQQISLHILIKLKMSSMNSLCGSFIAKMDDTTEVLPQNIQLCPLQVYVHSNQTAVILQWSGKALCIQSAYSLLYNRGERHTVVILVVSDVCFPPALKDSIFNVLHVLITSALLSFTTLIFVFDKQLPSFPKQYYQHCTIIFSQVQVFLFHCPLGESQLLIFTKNGKLENVKQEKFQLESSRNGEAEHISFHSESEFLGVFIPPSTREKGTNQSFIDIDPQRLFHFPFPFLVGL